MIRLCVAASVVIVCLLGFGSVAQADPVSVGSIIRLYDGPGNNGGGEFYADVEPFGGSAPYDFITFCLQRTEYFTPGQSMYIGGISNATQSENDPIGPETAYLYTGMRGGTLQNYAFTGNVLYGGVTYDRVGTATALQMAFWILEGENVTGLQVSPLTDFYINTATSAVTSGAWSGLGDVKVLNLYGSYSNGTFSGDKQDQLVIHSVAEPGTLSLFGVGLLMAARLAHRRRRSH
jgi:hypothetical protein